MVLGISKGTPAPAGETLVLEERRELLLLLSVSKMLQDEQIHALLLLLFLLLLLLHGNLVVLRAAWFAFGYLSLETEEEQRG